MRRFILILIGVGITGGSFVIGRWYGSWYDSASTSEKLMEKEMNHWDQLAELDRTVLQTFPVRSNTMTSGTYLMQVWFPNQLQPGSERVFLRCENGHISVPATNRFRRNGEEQTFSITGNVVSWTEEGVLYESNPKYVGLIDGNEMWGRVYGWGPDGESVGLWRIYPNPPNPVQEQPTNQTLQTPR